MKYSDEQKKALEIRNRDLIISAQAGAGKTQVLVERVIRQIVEEGYFLDQILLVTFTNKAAGELKSRIRRGLFQVLEKNPPEEKEQRNHLLQEITRVSSANIQTLHAFCFELIRDHYERLSLDPSVRILDEKKMEELKEESLDTILRKVYEKKDPDIFSFIELYGLMGRRDDQPLRQLIVQFSEEKEKKIDGDKWVKDWLEEIASPAYDQKIEEICRIRFEKQLIDLAAEIKDLVDKAEAMPEKYKNALEEENRSAQESLEAWRRGEKKEIIFLKRMPSVGKKEGEWAVERKDLLNSRRAKIKDKAKALFSSNLPNHEEIHEENQRMKKYLTLLSFLTDLFEKALREKKKEQNGLDFNDVEHLTLDLLNFEEEREKVKNRFSLVYFDEYQDASQIQNEIIERIKNPKGLFFVGDVKQSIYGFRQACPENFQNRYEEYAKNENQEAEALDFTVNYRSLPGILKFVNFLFIPLMTKNRGSIAYDSPIHRSRIQPYPEETLLAMQKGKRFAGKVHVLILEKNPDEDEQIGAQSGTTGNMYLNEKSAEAFYIARKIKEHVAKGGKYKDMAILLRKDKGRIFEFESVLRAFHIPVHSEGDKVDEEATELKIAISLLQILDNKQKDLPLLTVLSSVIGNFSDEDLARIRIFYPEGSFYQAIQHFLKDGEEERRLAFSSFSEEEGQSLRPSYYDLWERLETFDQKLDSWRDHFSQMPFSRAVWKIIQASGLYAYSSSLDFGKERRENLNLLLRMAESYEEEGNADLYGFLHLLGEEPAFGKKAWQPAGSFSEEDDVVRIMTIHAAKGLDFKTVFLAGLGGKLSGGKSSVFAADDELGPALLMRSWDPDGQTMIQGPSYVRELLRGKEEKNERDEEVRILYVAMTRASEELYLIGQESLLKKGGLDLTFLEDSASSLQNELDQSTTYIQWILTILRHDRSFWLQSRGGLIQYLSFHQDQLPKRNFYGLSSERPSPLLDIELEWPSRYRPWDGKLDWENSEEKGKEENHSDSDCLSDEQVKEALDFQYPYWEDTRKPLKETVTELAKKERRWEDPQAVIKEAAKLSKDQEPPAFIEEPLKLPSFITEKGKFGPAQFGSLMHRALQSLPFKKYQLNSLKEELNLLEQREIFTPEEREALSLPLLLTFYQSEKAIWLSDHADALYRERPFTMRLRRNGEVLTVDGQIDLYVDLDRASNGKEHGFLLVDYKTARRPHPEFYLSQLRLYAKALETAFGKKVEKVYLYWIRLGKWEEVLL